MTRRGANEGTIRERKDGRWEARVIVTRSDGRKTRRSLLGRSRADVRDKLQAALRGEASGLPLPAERLTVGAFLDQWLRDSVRPSVRPRTCVSYAGIVRVHLGPGLGQLPLGRLSPQQVQAFSTRSRRQGSRRAPSATFGQSSARHSGRRSAGVS